VIDARKLRALVFPCHRVLRGWVKANESAPVDARPLRNHAKATRSCPVTTLEYGRQLRKELQLPALCSEKHFGLAPALRKKGT
jgi:hypothetical protein